MLEEERKFLVEDRFELPDLSPAGRIVAKEPVTLRATYYDTEDRRLARAGVSLRHRKGEAPQKAWTVKLPSDVPGTRHELSRPGNGDIPAELLALVTVYHRGAPLAPAAVVRTVRTAYDVLGRDGTVLAEVADDAVSVLDGRRITKRFREIEVERIAGKSKVLDRVETLLRAAGAEVSDFVPKHVRAMGAAAEGAPDLVAPQPTRRKRPTAGEVVTTALRRDIQRIFAYEPFVRLRQPLADGDTPVHQMRVGTRRLRSDLRTFRQLLDPAWAKRLRDELGWLADALGAARDAEVLRARLHRTAGADGLAPLDEAAVARIDAELTVRHEEALSALDEVLRAPRYLRLLDALIDAARAPQLARAADEPAAEALPAIVVKPWRQLVYGGGPAPGAGGLVADGPDDEWHAVRIRAKRARYSAEAVAAVVGGGPALLSKALARVQELLGEHQDAAIAADTWLEIAKSDPDDHALAVTAGRLYERERSAIQRARGRFPEAWRAATKKKVTKWLS